MSVRRLLLVLLLAGCSAPRSAPDASSRPEGDAVWLDAVESGDTEAAVEALQATFEATGVEFGSAFGWDLAPYDEPLNLYNTATSRVTLGRAPTAEETSAYWQIYSDRLTGGSWSADAFFASPEEARRMASFNQAYLAAHEAGHALAYHYAVNPPWDRVGDARFRTNVHCQELLADRIAAAFLAEAVASDPRVGAYRARYLELMASLDAAIPAARRVRLSDLESCSETAVVAPQDEATFQSYASAFFERQRLLLSGPPVELVDTLDEHILWRRAAFVADVPDLPGTGVMTHPLTRELPRPTTDRGEFPSMLGFSLAMRFDSLRAMSETVEGMAYAILDDGSAYAVTSVSTIETDTASAAPPYTYADFRVQTILRIAGEAVELPDLGETTAAVVQSSAARSSDDLFALLAVSDVSDSDSWELPSSLQLLRIRRADGGWRAEAGPVFPRTDGTTVDDVMVGADGAVFVESAERLYGVDLARLAPSGEGQSVELALGDLLTLDAQGRRLSVRHDVVGGMVPNGGLMSRFDAGAIVVRSGPEGAVALAGSGLPGHRDGPGPRAHLGRVLAIRAVEDGVRVLQWSRGMQLRHIRVP